MATIKIKSNPYKKEITYQQYSATDNEWKDIDINSKLLGTGFTNCVFTFKAKEIVDTIISEFDDGEGIQIVFEGTPDEYKDLKLASEDLDVELVKSPIYLENAREILPQIIDIYKKVYPLVFESVSNQERIQTSLRKFADASNDVIPIVVIGNYSSGKSTFINALIGEEILPSGDLPVTAAIYKVVPSLNDDYVSVKLEINDHPVELKYEDDEFIFKGEWDKDIKKEIKDIIDDIGFFDYVGVINQSIDLINEYKSDEDNIKISDITEITIPFTNSELKKANIPFVIFDTPGSNSSSNINHSIVLKNALKDMSNGLPIFVSSFETLDTMDNEQLFRDVKSFEEIDSRFTMIVVNKADTANLPKGGFRGIKEKQILNQSVPKNLYAEGIYFVSSVIGLGLKNDQFVNDHNAEIYETNVDKYVDSTNRFYKQLYKYNIMPNYLKKKEEEKIEKYENMPLANSGLYSVENEIITFSKKYSAYNKCQQSNLFLNKILEITNDEIIAKKGRKEHSRQLMLEKLNQDQELLILNLRSQAERLHRNFLEQYPSFIVERKDELIKSYVVDEEDVKRLETDINDRYVVEKHLDDDIDNAKEAFDHIGNNIKDNVANVFHQKDIVSFMNAGGYIFDGFISNVGKSIDSRNKKKETSKEVDIATADELIDVTTKVFKVDTSQGNSILSNKSKGYWEDNTKTLRDHLCKTVMGSDVLDEETKDHLAEIIMNYTAITFDDYARDIFKKELFEQKFEIGDLLSIKLTDKLNISKLTRTYNDEMTKALNNIASSIKSSHTKSFDIWQENLLDTVEENIVLLNPELYSEFESIKEHSLEINNLENKLVQLSEYRDQISNLIDWHSEE